MSTSGLIVTRDPGSSRSVARQGTTALALAPGSTGPISTAASTPTAARPRPARSSDGAVPPDAPASHDVADTLVSSRWVNQWRITAARNAADSASRSSPVPRAPPKMNRVVPGMIASSRAWAWNAAASAMNATSHTPAAAASTKPGSTGAGATTWPNVSQASRSCSRATSSVSPVGTRAAVVSPSCIHVTTSTPLTTATTAVAAGCRPARRQRAARRWAPTAHPATLGRNEPSSNSLARPRTATTVMAASVTSLSRSRPRRVAAGAVIDALRRGVGRRGPTPRRTAGRRRRRRAPEPTPRPGRRGRRRRWRG
jgi:hypothetical protein